jgi:hypothetical protein
VKVSFLTEVTEPVLAANVADALSVRRFVAARNSCRPAPVNLSVSFAVPGVLNEWLAEATVTRVPAAPATVQVRFA